MTVSESFLSTIPFPFLYCQNEMDNNGKLNLRIRYANDECINILKAKDKNIIDNYITEIFLCPQIENLNDIIIGRDKTYIKCYEPSIKAFIKISFQNIDSSLTIVYITNILESKVIEDELRDNPIVFIKDKTGNIIECNEGYINYCKYEGSIYGKSDIEIWGKDLGSKIQKSHNNFVASGKIQIETTVWLYGIIYSIKRTAIIHEGEFLGLVGNITALTGSNKNNKLNYLEIFNNLLNDNTNKSIILRDVLGIVIDCNQNYLQYFNLEKENIVGKSIYEVYENKDIRDFAIKTDKDVLREGTKKVYLKEHLIGDKIHILEVIKAPFTDSYGNTVGLFISINDITYTKELDIQKFDFIANISHELRTPLNLVFSSLHVIEKLCKNETRSLRLCRYLNSIYVNSNRLLKISNNIIDTQQFQLGLYTHNIIKDNIVQYIELISLSVEEIARNKNLTLIFDTDIEEKTMSFDLQKLEKVLLNLLSNSIKYNRNNGKILVKLSDCTEGIKINIQDTGVGIEKNSLDLVFKQFKNIQNRFVKIAEGSGLGLYLTKKLIDIQGGKIEVESKVNLGTLFKITLPNRNNFDVWGKPIDINDYVQELRSRVNVELSDII